MNLFKKLLLFGIFTVSSHNLQAQTFPSKSVDISIGLGISAASNDNDVSGSGFYAQGEFVYSFNTWFALRPYAGLLLTSSDNDDSLISSFESSANIALVGGKGRLTAPIPWVAPYIEIGIGASIGNIITRTAFEDIDTSGITYHIPFTLGLSLGKNNGVDVAFVYYFHPTANQFSGAASVGISIPLKK